MAENIVSDVAIIDLAPYRFGKITQTGITFGTKTVDEEAGIVKVYADGIIINSRTIYTKGKYVDLKVRGVCKVEIKEGETISKGDYVVPDAGGTGKAVKNTIDSSGFKVTSIEGNYCNVIL